MEQIKVRKVKGTLVILTVAAFMLLQPAKAEAFSLKRLLNPFKVGVSSVLHPFHLFYKVNKIVGSNPVKFIPGDSLVPSERRWVKDPSTNNWDKYSWELDDNVPPVQQIPDLPDITPRPPISPPAPIVVTPPCQRGGPGITPC